MPANSSTTDDDGLNATLTALAQRGAWALDAIKAIRGMRGVSLAQAKLIVFNAPPWSETRQSHERFVDDLLAALESEIR